jgi:hypothetical protein
LLFKNLVVTTVAYTTPLYKRRFVISQSLKQGVVQMGNENTLVTEADVSVSVEGTLGKLREQYSAWRKHQADSDNMLYVLLENCLDFYYFLRQNEQYESAFKSLCDFKWNAKTKVTLLIAKAVFGEKTKMSNAYARAIEKAALEKIGKDNQTSMLAWLQSNGGVNGVIRNENPSKSATAALQDQKEEVGRNYSRYKIRCRIEPFVNKQMAQLMDGEWAILCRVNSSSGQVEVVYLTQTKEVVGSLYSEFGASIMASPAYKNRRIAVEAEIALERAQAADMVGEELRRILDKAKGGDGKLDESEAAA